MKRLVLIFGLIFSVFCVHAQKNVYVLIDLSKSIDKHQLQEAKKVLTQILQGTTPSDIEFITGFNSDLQKFQLKQNDQLSVNVFGGKALTCKMKPELTIIKDNNTIDKIVNNVSWYLNQEWTYYKLAKAIIARDAKDKGIESYLLCIISDGYDSFPDSGKPGYDDDQKNLVIKYDSGSEGVVENRTTTYKMSDATKHDKNKDDLLFTLISDVDISKFMKPNKIKYSSEGINIIIPTRANKDKPFLIDSENVKLEWQCTSKLTNLVYSVTLNGYDGNNYSNIIDTLTTETYLLKSLINGKYEIIVSANNSSIIPDTTYIDVNKIKDTKIKITSPVGTKKKPNEIKGEKLNVSWRCPDCNENTTYTVSVAGTDGNKNKAKPVKVKNFSANFNDLSSGKYRVTVSGDNGASSDTTYIEVSSGGGAGWFFILLLLAAAGIGAYFLLKKMKDKEPTQSYSDNSYSSNKKPSNNSNSNMDTSDDGIF